MTYQSKKDPQITASLDFIDPKYKTAMMIYLTGEEAGKSFTITESTLKRWWKKIGNENSDEPTVEDGVTENPLNIDEDKVNEPYPSPIQQKYIPKPKSVVEYENKKHKKHNTCIPEFEALVELLGAQVKKVNENSRYIKIEDGTTIWRKESLINIYAAEETWTKLTEAGLQSKPNKDKARPFGFDIAMEEDFEKVKKAFNV